MRIILAKTAGFCMGVKRAMDTVLALARTRKGPILTFGPLIHNRQVIEMLEARGICARTDFEGSHAGTVLLRTHGVPPDVVERLRAAGLEVEDGTCPHVLRGQRSVERRSAEGYDVILVGDRDHDEVAGLAGHAAGPCVIIAGIEEARRVPLGDKVIVVAQTTFNESLFHEIVDELRARKPDIEVVDSICTATSERQAEARELAGRVDAMIVVGGYHSANTARLAEIARAAGTPTYHVETAEDLDAAALAPYRTVGVTAGASTPSWITASVIDRLRGIGRRRSRLSRVPAAAARFLIDSNLYVAGGAAALTYAATKMMALHLGEHPRWNRFSLMLAAFGYIFSAYLVGRRAESGAGGPGLTRRGAFYRGHRTALAAASVALTVVSLAAVVQFGVLAAVLLGVSYATAIAYGFLTTPRGEGRMGFLRDVPASKDLFAAAGWTVAAVCVPVVAARNVSPWALAAAAAFVFGLAFIRSVMFDFSDVTCDRLLGRETLPALIGVSRARTALAVVATLMAGGLVAAVAAGALAGPGYWMLLCPAYVLCYLVLFLRPTVESERTCAVVVDGGMWLAGLVAVAHTLWA